MTMGRYWLRKLSCLAPVFAMSACSATPSAHPARPEQASSAGAAANVPSSAQRAGGGGSGLGPLDNPSLGGAGALPMVPQQDLGACRAGHYLGSFMGDYISGAWIEGETIVFATSDVDGKPGFEFWLESMDQECPPDLEFCPEAVVKGGKLRGNVIPFSDPEDPSTEGGLGFSVRFEIDLTGELDCRTGTFRGRLENGCYDILSTLYRFAGTIDGDYSRTANEFTNGVWHVDELLMPGAMPATPLGGGGTWSAKYADDATPPTGPSTGLCSGETGFDTEL